MIIFYGENPLNAVYTLTKSDLEIIKLRSNIDCILEKYVECDVDLEWTRENKSQPPNAVKRVQPVRTPEDVINRLKIIEKVADEEHDDFLDWHYNLTIESLNVEHEGDCLKMPQTCRKCMAESLLGLNDSLYGGPNGEGDDLTDFMGDKSPVIKSNLIYGIGLDLFKIYREKNTTLDQAIEKSKGNTKEFLQIYKKVRYGKTSLKWT